MAALDESILTKMNRRYVIIKYGGNWEGCEYIKGDAELLLIPSGGISRASLIEEIHGIVGADQKTSEYLLFCLVKIGGESRQVKLRIKNDVDLSYVMAAFQEPLLYVVLKRKEATPTTRSPAPAFPFGSGFTAA